MVWELRADGHPKIKQPLHDTNKQDYVAKDFNAAMGNPPAGDPQGWLDTSTQGPFKCLHLHSREPVLFIAVTGISLDKTAWLK